MWTGTSLAVLAIGSILAFAVEWTVEWIDLGIAGWILIGLGTVGLLASMATIGITSRATRGRDG